MQPDMAHMAWHALTLLFEWPRIGILCLGVVIGLAIGVLPGLNGIETVRRARERWPGLRVLYVTGYASAAATGLETGDDPMIRKPFRLAEFTAEGPDVLTYALQRGEKLFIASKPG